MTEIDLNADLGESYGAWRLGDDDALLDVITSANVACGFHAGDPATMMRTVRAAVRRNVVIGAQVSYPDLVGFGRRDMDISAADIVADVLYQLGALDGIARAHGRRVAYVKPHGALYNRAARDAPTATAIGEAIRRYGRSLPLLMLAGSIGAATAGETVPVVAECFADRGYEADGRLLPRSAEGAVIEDPDAVVARAVRMARDGEVETRDGSVYRLGARSICLHGDTPGAATLAHRVRAALADTGIAVRAFA